MHRFLLNNETQSFQYIYYLSATLLLLSTLFNYSSGFSDDCDIATKKGNIFIDPELLLKETNVFSDFSKAPKCVNKSCDNSDICTTQLRNVSVSNMLPCCVQFVDGTSVCQCVNALLDSDKKLTQCPSTSLKLVSNQIFIMFGISRFFEIDVPVCGRLFSSWNIYKGTGPNLNTTADPFVKESGKSGFTFSTAFNKDGWYINFYTEFVTTCKTLLSFISDDLPPCNQNECNVEPPHVNILLDLRGVDIRNPVFKNLKSKPKCKATTLANNQCPANPTENSCDIELEPCCYSERCMFPFIFGDANDTCPCPPVGSQAVYTNNFPLDCHMDNIIYLFNKRNPPVSQVFIWDFDPEPLETSLGQLLVGRGTIKFEIANSEATLYWFGEFRLTICAFAQCLGEILLNLKSFQVPSFLTPENIKKLCN